MAAKVLLHPHAQERLSERGASEAETITTVLQGERFSAKFGRTGFRRNFSFQGEWRGRKYKTKQIEAYAINEEDAWLVISVMVKYF